MRLDPWSEPVIDDWLSRTPVERHNLVYDALFSIVEGTWYQLYEHYDFLARPGSVAMRLSSEEVVVWQVLPEAPGVFRVWYIGKVDH